MNFQISEESLKNLISHSGYFSGPGINHEKESFTGDLVIRSVFGGVLLWFRAQGEGGQIFHEEVVLIGKSPEGLTMTSQNTNIPFVQIFKSEHALTNSYSFTIGDFTNDQSFRERVTLAFTDNAVIYNFAWGLPGQQVEDRSSAKMTQASGKPKDCPIAL